MIICLVFSNSDMSEGRGPMSLDKVFSSLEKGKKYVEGRCGIMGRKCPLEKMNENYHRFYTGCIGFWRMNDHDLVEIKVE